MQLHIKLSPACCVICRYSTTPNEYAEDIEDQERVAAVLGDSTSSKYAASTLSFDFPSHGHNFKSSAVYINSREESRRLCRYSRCSTCQVAPETFIFRMDCFRLFERIIRKVSYGQRNQSPAVQLILSQVWLAGHWSRPWRGAYYDTPVPFGSPSLLPAQMSPTSRLEKEFLSFVEKVVSLPLELLQSIRSYCADSTLWRYSVVLSRPLGKFSNLRDGEIKILSPKDLLRWSPDGSKSLFPLSKTLTYSKNTPKFVRFALDAGGIRSVEFFNSQSKDSQTWSESQGTWYIIEDFSRLTDVCLQSKDGFLRLVHKHEQGNWILWDTPNPPNSDICTIFRLGYPSTPRIRSILLRSITGLTVFCAHGCVYGIHAHRDGSSVDATWSKFPKKLRQILVCLHFPFGSGETVKEVWVRTRVGPKAMANPNVVLYTSHDRLYTLGQFIDFDDSDYSLQHLASRPEYLLYSDPEPGEPIFDFATSSHQTLTTQDNIPLPVLPKLGDYHFNASMYCSHASLEGVTSVRCFYTSNNDSLSMSHRFCTGILIEYANKGRAALGQACMETSQIVQVHAPVTMYLKTLTYEGGRDRAFVQFTSIGVLEEFERLNWEKFQMKGAITWCFDERTVQIICS